MSEKALIIFISAAIGTLGGYYVMRSYRRDLEYLTGVCSLIAELKRNIAYRRDSVAVALSAIEQTNVLLKKQVEEYIAFVKAKDGALELTRGRLSVQTYGAVKAFFSSLGGADDASQLKELELHGSRLESLRARAEDKSKKYGPLAVKLGFLLGLGVGVLFL